jgi:bacterial/archaeal transporter family-2 protein
MNKLFWVIMVLLAGAVAPIQAGLNAKLGKSIENPIYASLISFLVGCAGLIFYILITGQTVSWSGFKSAPAYVWIGGILGAFFVTVLILAFPKIGPAWTFALVVAGQMIISVGLEHFNLLAAQHNPINWFRVLGVLLIISGVILIRKF